MTRGWFQVRMFLKKKCSEENKLFIDRQYVHHPTDEPYLTHVESSGRERTRPNFFKPTRWFGAKIVPPRMPHRMSECSDWPFPSTGFDETERSYWPKLWEFGPAPTFACAAPALSSFASLRKGHMLPPLTSTTTEATTGYYDQGMESMEQGE